MSGGCHASARAGASGSKCSLPTDLPGIRGVFIALEANARTILPISFWRHSAALLRYAVLWELESYRVDGLYRLNPTRTRGLGRGALSKSAVHLVLGCGGAHLGIVGP